MRILIKLTFFFWLAISALLVLTTERHMPSGQVALAGLCALSFFGGVSGIFAAIYDAIRDDTR